MKNNEIMAVAETICKVLDEMQVRWDEGNEAASTMCMQGVSFQLESMVVGIARRIAATRGEQLDLEEAIAEAEAEDAGC